MLFRSVLLLGQLMRARLAALGPAFAELKTNGPSAALDATLRTSVDRSRPYVMAIWLAMLAAALLGVLKLGVPAG